MLWRRVPADGDRMGCLLYTSLVGLEVASLLIDHSSVEMTRNYANVDNDELAEAVVKTGLQADIWGVKAV